MPIHTQDYRHWEGTLKPRNYTRWWIIAKAELKLLAQRKIVRLIVAIPPVIYIFVHAILIYIINQVPDATLPFEVNADFFQKFQKFPVDDHNPMMILTLTEVCIEKNC